MNNGKSLLIFLAILVATLASAAPAHAQRRRVTFPPAESPPPPPMKQPPKMQAAGEETDLPPDPGPAQRKTQERTPPPPTNLTVMYKVEYGETLEYVHPNGTVQKFEQWKSYPNDAYNLVTYTNQRLADGNNYQYATKPLASPGFDPVDIPILFMAGDYDFALKPAEVENLRKFLTMGGTIIFNAARGRDEFSLAVAREMRKVLPGKQLMRLPLDHPIYNARYRVQQVLTLNNGVQVQQQPEVYSIDIGTRAAAILIPSGMGASWSGTAYHPAGKHLVGESAIRLGVNLIAYVLGSTEYGKFLAQDFYVFDAKTRPGDSMRYAMVKYSGAWDVNPVIQNSVLQGLNDATGVGVDYNPTVVALDDKELGNYPILFMTGHYDFKFTQPEIDNLADYLKRGGLLFASAAGGLKPFDTAFRREIKRLYPKADLIKIPPSHPIFASGYSALDKVMYTPAALRDNASLEYPEFWGLFIEDRLAVVYTPFDMMSGLNREANAYAKGLTGDDAMRVMVNVMTYALSH